MQTATIHQSTPFRVLHLTTSDDGQLPNDGSATETLQVAVVDGLQVARGTDPSDADVLDAGGEATVTVDGVAQSVSLTGGTGSLDVTTTASAGSTIRVQATDLAEHPAEQSDVVEIEVVSA
ncbi:hypothetical protein J2752_000474 [Halarchaeum rubridurum]|uniref:Uncharacterized protein n=1 Tax=Halarchaeum rubridurum TaxID=489911 RepID=A0A8T4GMS1_9EURY|nr:hypothetical protein [Halarchaeum rubridurum]MBP1953593.1 hypothetical protein [Halarchaeum rubridurum]